MEDDIFSHALSDHSSDMSSRQKEMEEIIVKEILPRFPAKTLLRFKSVSPNFNSHISSPFLVRLHFMYPKSLSGLFYHMENNIRYVSFDPLWSDLPDPSLSYLPELVSIKASTHGMLCVGGEYTLEYYITNPTTKNWVKLPQPAVKHPDDVEVVVAFEEPAVYNFGSDYRVVCTYPSKDQRVCILETFSSDKWAWDRSEKTCAGENIVAGSGNPDWEDIVSFWVSQAMPIRSQGSTISAVMREKYMLVLRDMQGEMVHQFDAPDICTGFVPYISTLVPVRSCDAGNSTGLSVNNNDTGSSSGAGMSTEPSVDNNDTGSGSGAGMSTEPSVSNNDVICKTKLET